MVGNASAINSPKSMGARAKGADKKSLVWTMFADDAVIKTTSDGGLNMSASADAANARGRSMVRIVNVDNTGNDVALRMGEQTLSDNVKTASVTDYREVVANMADFSARRVGPDDTTALATNKEVLMDGHRYTVFLIAEDVAKNTLRIVQDEIIPDSGKARIRVLHASCRTSPSPTP